MLTPQQFDALSAKERLELAFWQVIEVRLQHYALTDNDIFTFLFGIFKSGKAGNQHKVDDNPLTAGYPESDFKEVEQSALLWLKENKPNHSAIPILTEALCSSPA